MLFPFLKNKVYTVYNIYAHTHAAFLFGDILIMFSFPLYVESGVRYLKDKDISLDCE